MGAPAKTDRGMSMSRGGPVSKVLIDLFMKRAAVVAIDDVADRFRLVTLEGSALRDVAWVPGTQVQFPIGGSLLTVRTFTPIEWNMTTGRVVVLAYLHGQGPGGFWLDRLVNGDRCDLYGPRKSIDIPALPGSLAVFGDETSIRLGYALSHRGADRVTGCYLEIADVTNPKRVIDDLGVENVTCFSKKDDDAHLVQMEACLPALANAGTSFVLTGKAGTIQRLRQGLKRLSVASDRIVTKAYWAPGKQGLD